MRGRFKTANNKTPGFREFLNLPVSIIQTLNRKLFNIYPELPWIPFSAIKKLDKTIKPDWKVLEIGAGMSTIWLSKRCDTMVSIEADTKWFELLGSKIKAKHIENIDLHNIWQREEMADFSKYPDNYFDLVYVDGGPRELCSMNSLKKLKKDGYLYLDNTDTGMVDNAPELLKPHFKAHEYFIDFVPGNIMINEGMLFHKKI